MVEHALPASSPGTSLRTWRAVLITPEGSAADLNIKYALQYDRIRTALDSRAKVSIEWANASDAIFDLMESDADELPTMLHLDESIADDERVDNRSELDSAIWFVSLLTRVDGLVLMDHGLNVAGFGVEITAVEEPESIVLAKDAVGLDTSPLAYTRIGTRHRSMMRVCWQVPESVGFVLSQDGDVRVMTRVDESVVVWENPLLQLRIEEPQETGTQT